MTSLYIIINMTLLAIGATSNRWRVLLLVFHASLSSYCIIFYIVVNCWPMRVGLMCSNIYFSCRVNSNWTCFQGNYDSLSCPFIISLDPSHLVSSSWSNDGCSTFMKMLWWPPFHTPNMETTQKVSFHTSTVTIGRAVAGYLLTRGKIILTRSFQPWCLILIGEFIFNFVMILSTFKVYFLNWKKTFW